MCSSARKHVISFLSQMQKALPEYICRECWERHLREDLFRGCAIENVMSVAGRVGCSACGAVCDIYFPVNRFLCSECDHMEYCDAEDQKQILDDDYFEIDEEELSEVLAAIK